MPRRALTRTTTITPDPQRTPSTSAQLPPRRPSETVVLRTQWKWAAFSQFFFTFAHLFSMSDVALVDIENDLTRSTNIFLPRVMQRLLYTLTQDRKITPDNWQTILRKQYLRRDPQANPIGFEISHMSPEPSIVSAGIEEATEVRDEESSILFTIKENPTTRSEDLPFSPTDDVPPVEESAGDKIADSLDTRSYPPVDILRQSSSNIADESAEDYKDWLDLPMLAKLDSLHLLTEWQFHNTTRLRSTMRNDDELASWRIEPIGYDAKQNAYWFIGAERLWIQRALPKPNNLKRKRGGVASLQAKSNNTSTKRSKLQPKVIKEGATSLSFGQAGKHPAQNHTVTANGARGGRAAKTQANIKLETQARELAELNRQASKSRKQLNGVSQPSGSRLRPLGTRLSARLRGAEDEWQPVPDEWLAEDSPGPITRKGTRAGSKQLNDSPTVTANRALKTGLESDVESISDLTELSEEDNQTLDTPDISEEPSILLPTSADRPLEEPPILPADFIEWETICVTLFDWEHIAERFEKASHYSEKALYKVLVNDVVPFVIENLKEVDRKRRLEEALVHRKRSSRIAIKESEKEEARMAARKQAEEEEKMSRARRLEVRLQKEEADRERREAAREQRRKEREAKELLQKQQIFNNSDVEVNLVDERSVTNGVTLQSLIPFNGTGTASHSGSRTPVGDDWELNCEICHKSGVNVDDGRPMMSCGGCSKWQHIPCHDDADFRAGRPKRNWDLEEFFCQQCQSRASSTLSIDNLSQLRKIPNQHSLPTSHPFPDSQYTISPVATIPVPPTGTHNTASHPNSGLYPRDEASQIRSTVIPNILAPPQSINQPSITFSHYQPHRGGFSTTQVHSHYGSSHIQPYPHGPLHQSLSHTQYPGTNGHAQPYSQNSLRENSISSPYRNSNGQIPLSYQQNSPSRSQPEWAVPTPTLAPGYPSYDLSAERSGHWQQPTLVQSPSTAALPVNHQFRHHPTSYQSPS